MVVCGALRGVAFPEGRPHQRSLKSPVSIRDCASGRGGRTLRSSLVYAASKEIPNRFQLCQTISKAARVLHLATNPTEITINRVLQDISHPVSELKAAGTEGVL
jgi:hypothetical protein